jgi:hypothetical protein
LLHRLNIKWTSLIATSQVPAQNADEIELLNKPTSNVRISETILYTGKLRTNTEHKRLSVNPSRYDNLLRSCELCKQCCISSVNVKLVQGVKWEDAKHVTCLNWQLHGEINILQICSSVLSINELRLIRCKTK